MILTSLLPKIGIPLLFVGGGFIGGLAFQAKVLDKKCPEFNCPKVTIPKCPDCNCPPTLGTEIDKIKAKGRANLTIHMHQNYTSCSDSTDLRLIINESVTKALENYSLKKKR